MAKRRSGLGSGGAYLGFAKLYFMFAAYVTIVVLSWLLDESTFGDYSVVARIISIPNMVIIYTLMFTVSRPMAAEFEEDSPNYSRLRSRGFKMALQLGGATSVVFFLGAPIFAGWLSEEALVWPIRVVAPISLVYALYAINVGTLNARRIFSRQAALDVFMATSKAGLIIAVAALGYGLAPTLAGFTGASMLAFLLSIVLVRAAKPDGKAEPKSQADVPMAGLAGILVIYTLSTTLLLSIDLLVVKHFAMTPEADAAVGFYSGAQYVAQVPYSLLNAISLLVFPLIATLHAQGDEGKVREYITSTAHVVLLLLALMSSVAFAASPEILGLLYKQSYVTYAADDMRWMVLGYSGFSFAVTSGWIFNSAKRSRWAIGVVGAGLLCSAGGSWFLVPSMGSAGAAQAVAVAGGVAILASVFGLWRAFGVTLSAVYVLKLAVTAGVVVFVGLNWPVDGKIMALVKLTALTLIFGAGAAGLRLVTLEQMKGLRRAA